MFNIIISYFHKICKSKIHFFVKICIFPPLGCKKVPNKKTFHHPIDR